MDGNVKELKTREYLRLCQKYQRELTPCQDGILCKGCAFYDEPSACIELCQKYQRILTPCQV